MEMGASSKLSIFVENSGDFKMKIVCYRDDVTAVCVCVNDKLLPQYSQPFTPAQSQMLCKRSVLLSAQLLPVFPPLKK